MSEKSGPRKSRAGRIVVIVVVVLLALVGIAYGVAWFMAGEQVPRGTTVHGIDLTDLSPAQAEAKLREKLSPFVAGGLTLAGDGKTATLNPADAGLSVDFAATVRKAGGRSWNPLDIWRVFFGGGQVDPVTLVDDARLKAALKAAAGTFTSEKRPASIAYDGVKVVVTSSANQSELDVEATASRVVEAWAKLDAKVDVALALTPPEITTEHAEEIARSYAEPAVSGPIEMVTEKGKLTLSPEMIAGATTFAVEGDKIVPSTSAARLLADLKPAIDALKLPVARDATFTLANGRPAVVPGIEGLSLPVESIEKLVLPRVAAPGKRIVEVPLVKEPPKLTTDAANKLGIKEVTGEFTTYFPNSAYRNNNLPRAAAALNGTVIKPGETFSFNRVVGQRTVGRGYVAGGAICSSNKICQQLGGGVSQVATTTYNAFFFSGLKRVAHQPHTLYFSRYPAGRESTIDWGHIDVSFFNDTPYGVYIQGYGVPGSSNHSGTVTIRVWSTKEFDVRSSALVRSNYTTQKTVESSAADCAPQDGQGGFDVTYNRLWYKGGKLVRSEPYSWRYTTADRIICKKPTSSPAPTPTR